MAKMLFFIRILIVGIITLASVCYAEKPVFVPPAQRALPQSERPWQKNTFVVVAYHDIEDDEADQRYLAARTSALNEQFAWLRDNRYNVISVDQILAARNGGPALPNKAVLLTFDDGYSSFYRRVYPLLKAYNWHGVLAPVGIWLDTPANKNVDFGGLSTPRDRFATWKQITEMSQSGLVEIGAHTYASHYGALANPQGNTEPAAANLIYDAKTKTYETEAAFKQRMEKDVALITERIIKATGKQPRVWVWPYGAANGTVLNILRQQGYQLAMTLEPGIGNVNDLMNIPRILISNNPSLKDFALTITSVQEKDIMRVAHVDLDYLYDPDPVQERQNLDKLVQRIADLRVTTVFLQAFSDPKGDGNIRQVYFPNRWIPMRQDLFNRVAWQLASRPDVKVYAWMPVLAFEMDPSLPRVTRIDPKTGKTSLDPDQYRRLSPFNPEVRQRIIDIYRDMAYSAPIDGVLYHDDAVMSDFEDASPDAIQAYEKAGFPGSIATIRQDPEMMQRWTRYKSQYLVDFTNELTRQVRDVRGPQVKSARNIFAMPILEPESEAWFAQNLDDFLANYDWVAPMAMPLMEKVPLAQSNEWLAQLVNKVAQRPGALDKTVFELQSKDWTKPEGNNAISGPILAGWMRQLQLNGAQNFGYYPDNFITGEPPLKDVRPVLSSAWYPLYDR
ncbi:poly-beta-1,6-N-acetyl-D-glucosamine N-deacetylase PgaB [Yersinia kristensenii]|uniref:poly-beta-1,6-N-acetyl-D-glucosamine N-deacetylase PgaB n=1 Tax=Yersinia kristensenii TaxID=28152 RepID=UPI0028533EDC|nr:poly-beta-1,6-N-acetyl-D-glucosamine N-deacetylase PgaB [Yersinia kristensenii]MDR4896052.1 poly-beta-1,6-N-acetyl-D-glucosamine N-deacetylase PgaB [Yersinia kristensenii]MDX6734675.1 poly-beta-1,6-N-acetyl-D-glucosamine N-deacetylase PgaB [Yersinia kristensenii]